MTRDLTISEAARRCGVKVPTIRYYEQIGLLTSPHRTSGNRRQYKDDDVRRLAFIRHARELGFEIDAIKTLLKLQDDPHQSCQTADAIARARLIDVEYRIKSLQALKSELKNMIASCDHGSLSDCRVIQVLADHDKCLNSNH